MLSHSRGGSGDWTPSDINALVEEALNLAYHGARAQDNAFNVTLELVKRGYTEQQIVKIWGGNLLRVWKDVEKAARK